MTKLLGSLTFAAISATLAQNGPVHITKDCGSYTGLAGGYCTIVSSNVPAIPMGSTVFYDQAAGIPAPLPPPASGMLDSNVVLYVGFNDWAVGRCTLNIDGSTGLCTFSDGVGPLAGFSARVNVSFVGGTDGAVYAWDGTYSFNPSVSPGVPAIVLPTLALHAGNEIQLPVSLSSTATQTVIVTVASSNPAVLSLSTANPATQPTY